MSHYRAQQNHRTGGHSVVTAIARLALRNLQTPTDIARKKFNERGAHYTPTQEALTNK